MSNKQRLSALLIVMGLCGSAVIAFVAYKVYRALPILSGEGQYNGESTSHWIDSLQEKDPVLRKHAIASLGAIGSDAQESIPALSKILREDEDKEVRATAALALYKIGGKETVPALIAGLDDDFEWVRMNCALALARAGTSAEDAVPALTVAMSNPNNLQELPAFHISVRQQSIQALGKIGPAAKSAIPPLIEALKDKDVQTRSRAAIALGCMGSDAMNAVPLLIIMLKEKDENIQENAANALTRISPQEAAKLGLKLSN